MLLQICLVFIFISSTSSTAINPIRRRAWLLLYKPLDISADCAYSQKLRYDISYGMGMSDSLTLVMRSMSEVDYECEIDIVTERDEIYPDILLVVVIRFPNYMVDNCNNNPKAFIFLKTDNCFLLCDQVSVDNYYSKYFVTTSRTRFRFRFINNSSINADMNANIYQITATTARKIKHHKTNCIETNETICTIDNRSYCFSNAVVCDGIKNCGVDDWFDEKPADCDLPSQYLGFNNVVAITILILCVLVAVTHFLLQSLPPITSSFFIFNANEDNRICIDPLFQAPKDEEDVPNAQQQTPSSVAPSSSDDDNIKNMGVKDLNLKVHLEGLRDDSKEENEDKKVERKNKVRLMSERFSRFRAATGRALSSLAITNNTLAEHSHH